MSIFVTARSGAMTSDGLRTFDRRSFIARSGAVLGAATLVAGCDDTPERVSAVSTREPEAFDPTDWASVRAQFDLKPDVVHLAAFVLASHPRTVRDAIKRYAAGLDEDANGYLTANEVTLDEDVRSAAAQYLGADASEVALTDSTTMGLAMLYNGLELKDDEEILATTHDFYSTHESVRLRSVRNGKSWRRIDLFRDSTTASVDEIVSNVERGIRPETRALATTWVHSSTGMKLPVRAIADALQEINNTRDDDERVLLCVDGVHGFGNQDVSPADLGCDFLVSGCHKWLFGPRGTGLIWGNSRAWKRVVPTIPAFAPNSMVAWFRGRPDGPAKLTPSLDQTPGGYQAFEYRWALKDAFEFHDAIGRDRVAARTQELAQRLKEGLSELDSVRVVTPKDPDLSAGIVCFEVANQQPPDVLVRLMDENISVSVTPYAQMFVRMGPSIVTSEEDIDRTLGALDEIA
jgi:selenocysteine lyase/cysteine desulfurase